MSYSFSFNAANKEEAKQKAAAEFDRVVEQQPIHRNDQKQALAAVESFVDLMPEPGDGEVVYVTVSGSVTWSGNGDNITGAGIQITTSTYAKPRQA